MLGKNSKKLQEHIFMLQEREVNRVSQVEELLKLNDGLLMVKGDRKVKVQALGKKREQVKGELEGG